MLEDVVDAAHDEGDVGAHEDGLSEGEEEVDSDFARQAVSFEPDFRKAELVLLSYLQ